MLPPGHLHKEHTSDAVIWDFPMRSTGGLSRAEYEAAEQEYREECERIEEEEDEGENQTGPSPRT